MFAQQATPSDAPALPVLIAGMPLPFEIPRPGTIPIPPQPEGRIIQIDDEEDEDGDESDDAPKPQPIYRRRSPYLN